MIAFREIDKALDYEECPRCSHNSLIWNERRNCNVCENDQCGWNDGEIVTYIPIFLLRSYFDSSDNQWEKRYLKRLIEATNSM